VREQALSTEDMRTETDIYMKYIYGMIKLSR